MAYYGVTASGGITIASTEEGLKKFGNVYVLVTSSEKKAYDKADAILDKPKKKQT
jgi:hypothetical protein